MRKLMLSHALGALLLCTALPVAAHALELPTRKAGLWELKMVMADGKLPAMTMQQCTDESTDKQLSSMFGPTQKDMCSKNDIQKTATGYVIDAVCAAGGMSMTSHSEVAGDFNSAYTVKVASQRDGGPAGMPRDASMTLEAKWMGACTADQKAGDIIMPGGMKMNVKDMDNMRNLTKKP